MQVLPHIIDSEQTLYSAVPLAIDLQHINSYMPHLHNPYGDCQLFLDQELPSTHFKFFTKSFAALKPTNAKGLSSPFSTILVGPAYACNQIMRSFEQWAIIDKQSLIIQAHKHTTVKMPKAKPRPSTKTLSLWQSLEHPIVWAQATFSTITVTTAYPEKLQTALQNFFDFPITVHPLAPISSGTHNELAAWLTAIYALVAARNLYRTVLCHSRSWIHHIQFFTKSRVLDFLSVQSKVPKLWKPLMCQQFLPFNTVPPQNNNTYNLAMDSTKFQTRVQAYHPKNIKISRIIGIGHANSTVLNQEIYTLYKTHKDFTLILNYTPSNVIITLPVNPSDSTTQALRAIAAEYLKCTVDSVSVQVTNNNSIPKITNYAILANMLIHACKKTRIPTNASVKIVSLDQCKNAKEHLCSASVVVEFDISMHSRELQLRQANIALDIGFVAKPNIVRGMIESIFFRTYFSLCGSKHNIDTKVFSLTVELLNEYTRSHSASVTQLVKQATIHAITHTLSGHTNTLPSKELAL